MAALDEAEAAGSTRDLGDLPGVELASLLAVELRRLGEEKRLAGKVDAVAEDVGGGADVGGAVQEAVDLDAPRRERHRAVEDGHSTWVAAGQLTGQGEHGAAAEGDDDRARLQAAEGDRARPVERQPSARRSARPPPGRRSGRAAAPRPPRAAGCGGTRPRAAGASRRRRAPGRPPTAPRRRTSTSPRIGAISAVQQTIGAFSLTRSSPVTRPTRSGPSCADRRRCASCASMRSGAAKTPRPDSARNSSAACVFPEFVGPRCATTDSGWTLLRRQRDLQVRDPHGLAPAGMPLGAARPLLATPVLLLRSHRSHATAARVPGAWLSVRGRSG